MRNNATCIFFFLLLAPAMILFCNLFKGGMSGVENRTAEEKKRKIGDKKERKQKLSSTYYMYMRLRIIFFSMAS